MCGPVFEPHIEYNSENQCQITTPSRKNDPIPRQPFCRQEQQVKSENATEAKETHT